ncbi:MAG TPA: helix-turn-helix domain-containing protein [Candidatus Aminicenantes bacterium]|nr:helix-turn-helix domain-containing protein [Candidatus Aminicenantes bacterium]
MPKEEKWDTLNIPDKLDAISGWCVMGATDEEIYTNLGVGKTTFNKWKKDYPELSELLKRKKPIANAAVIGAIYRSARGYDYEEEHAFKVKDQNGNESIEIVTLKKKMPPNPTLAIYYTKNRMPEEWRDRHELDVNDNRKYTNEERADKIIGLLEQRNDNGNRPVVRNGKVGTGSGK